MEDTTTGMLMRSADLHFLTHEVRGQFTQRSQVSSWAENSAENSTADTCDGQNLVVCSLKEVKSVHGQKILQKIQQL